MLASPPADVDWFKRGEHLRQHHHCELDTRQQCGHGVHSAEPTPGLFCTVAQIKVGQ
jgi:hypothetical protein